MALSRLAREFAAEIAAHDWSDAPWRLDRAGHRREFESPSKLSEKYLNDNETFYVQTNVTWVAAQVLGHLDPNFDVVEFARACGVDGLSEGTLRHGVRRDESGAYMRPGDVGMGIAPSARQEILAAAQRVMARSRRDTFTVPEIVTELQGRGTRYAESTIRTMITAHMCRNAPDNAATTYDDFERVGRGVYRLA